MYVRASPLAIPYNGLSSRGANFTNAPYLALATIFTIQKFMTLNPCNQHLMKIVVCVMQLATTHDCDLRISSQLRSSWAS